MYGLTPSGRPNTKTTTDPSRGQILKHKDHSLKKSGRNASCSWNTKNLEQEYQRQHEQHQNLVLEQQQLIVNQFFNVVTNLDGGEAENPNTSSVQQGAEGKILPQHNSSPLKHTALSNRVLNLKQY